MSLKDGEIHMVSLFGTGLLTVALFVPVLWFTEAAQAEKPPLRDREVIEATLAYSKQPQKQPQKKIENPDVEKPVGVSHDEKKQPATCGNHIKEDGEDCDDGNTKNGDGCSSTCHDENKVAKKQEDTKNPFDKFKHTQDDDSQKGKPTVDPGQFNGDERGFAPTNTGDPWFARLHRDMNFNPPEIAKGTSVPVGCVHITADGKIPEFTFDPPNGQKGDDDIQTAADSALRELKKARNEKPEPVPTHLLGITTKWLCFKFTVKSP